MAATRSRRWRVLRRRPRGWVPANAKYFTETAATGYAVPKVIARSAKVSTNFQTQMDTIIKGGASAQEFATKMAAFINAGG